MSLTHGQVTMNDEPTRSKLVRFCEKKIGQWVQAHSGQETAAVEAEETEPEFRVSFNEEEGTKQIACMTEIVWKGAHWRGCDLAADEQQAFIHSLKRLTPH